jgi:hypothetical protein
MADIYEAPITFRAIQFSESEVIKKKRVHRRDAEYAEITQRKTIITLRPLCVLCASAVN